MTDKKVYLICRKNKYFDLVSEKIFTDLETKPIILFNKYITYNNKISKNLLCGNKFKLYHKNNEIINLVTNEKLKIYKKFIYYMGNKLL